MNEHALPKQEGHITGVRSVGVRSSTAVRDMTSPLSTSSVLYCDPNGSDLVPLAGITPAQRTVNGAGVDERLQAGEPLVPGPFEIIGREVESRITFIELLGAADGCPLGAKPRQGARDLAAVDSIRAGVGAGSWGVFDA